MDKFIARILPTRNGNPTSPFPTLRQCISSDPTYKEWKPTFVESDLAWEEARILPTRNGNTPEQVADLSRLKALGSYLQGMETIHHQPPGEFSARARILPTRNGNYRTIIFGWSGTKLGSYLQGMETASSLSFITFFSTLGSYLQGMETIVFPILEREVFIFVLGSYLQGMETDEGVL